MNTEKNRDLNKPDRSARSGGLEEKNQEARGAKRKVVQKGNVSLDEDLGNEQLKGRMKDKSGRSDLQNRERK